MIVRGDKAATNAAAGGKKGKLSPIKAPRARGRANAKGQGTEDTQAPPANATPTKDRAQTKKTVTPTSTKRMQNSDAATWKPIVRGTLHRR